MCAVRVAVWRRTCRCAGRRPEDENGGAVRLSIPRSKCWCDFFFSTADRLAGAALVGSALLRMKQVPYGQGQILLDRGLITALRRHHE